MAFKKHNVTIKFLPKLAVVLAKNANYLAKISLKIRTSVYTNSKNGSVLGKNGQLGKFRSLQRNGSDFAACVNSAFDQK
jgi:hypothetical protein